MSVIYDNIKAICRHYKIKIADIESPATKGFISRYEAKGKIDELPIYVFNKLSQASGVSIDDIVRKNLADCIELGAIEEEIERLERRKAELFGRIKEGGAE